MGKQLATTTEAHATIAFATHDHRRCVQQALSQARAACVERGARLTQLREEVLRLVWQSHRPVGAYALLEMLGARAGSRRRPPRGRAAAEW